MSGASLWTRATPWRQGHVLSEDAVKSLGLIHSSGFNSTCVVVIGHDCDLVNDDLGSEPHVEVIVGCIPTNLDGNYSWAKSPRTLHFEMTRDGKPVTVELVATSKCLVAKEELANLNFTPDSRWSCSGKSLSILRSWLAVRYNRFAFPDRFVKHFADSKAYKGLEKLIKPTHKNLSGVFFDIDNGNEYDHSDGSAYKLKIVLVYPPGDEPLEAADEMDKLVDKVEDLFTTHHYDQTTNKWNGIQLVSCMSISEDEITIAQARLMNEWRYEHMSLKDEPDLS